MPAWESEACQSAAKIQVLEGGYELEPSLVSLMAESAHQSLEVVFQEAVLEHWFLSWALDVTSRRVAKETGRAVGRGGARVWKVDVQWVRSKELKLRQGACPTASAHTYVVEDRDLEVALVLESPKELGS